MRYKSKEKDRKRKNDTEAADAALKKEQQKKLTDPKDTRFFFCKVKGHSLVRCEINLTSVPRRIW